MHKMACRLRHSLFFICLLFSPIAASSRNTRQSKLTSAPPRDVRERSGANVGMAATASTAHADDPSDEISASGTEHRASDSIAAENETSVAENSDCEDDTTLSDIIDSNLGSFTQPIPEDNPQVTIHVVFESTSDCEGSNAISDIINPNLGSFTQPIPEGNPLITTQVVFESTSDSEGSNADEARAAQEADQYVPRQPEADDTTIYGQQYDSRQSPDEDENSHISLSPPPSTDRTSIVNVDERCKSIQTDLTLFSADNSSITDFTTEQLWLTDLTPLNLLLLDLSVLKGKSSHFYRTSLDMCINDLQATAVTNGNSRLTTSNAAESETVSDSETSEQGQRTSGENIKTQSEACIEASTTDSASDDIDLLNRFFSEKMFNRRTTQHLRLYQCNVNICIIAMLLLVPSFFTPKENESFLLCLMKAFFCDTGKTRENDTKWHFVDRSLDAGPEYTKRKSKSSSELVDMINSVSLHPKTSFAKFGRQSSVVMGPVTRFLPDTTNNAALDLAHVGYRLATLSALPSSVPVSRVRLADAGFYYRGQGDEMICYNCHARHSGWREEDIPLDVHRRISPECSHVVQRVRELSGATQNAAGEAASFASPPGGLASLSNPNTSTSTQHGMTNGHSEVPLEDGDIARSAPPAVNSSAASLPPRSSSNTRTGQPPAGPASLSGVQETMPHVLSRPQERSATSSSPNAVPSTFAGRAEGGSRSQETRGTSASGGGTPGQGTGPRQMFPRPGLDLGGAVYPMYQDMASRRRSFPHWDDRRAPALEQIILCGMFYAGYADCVRCFYCGVGLKHWEVTDDVWVEHVRWRPSCGYMRAVKGDNYIRRVLAQLGGETSGDNDSEPQELGRGEDNTSHRTAPGVNSAATSSHTVSSVSRNQTTTSRPSDQSAEPTSGSQTIAPTTATGSRAATSSTTSPSANCNNQNGAQPERGSSADAVNDESSSERVARLQAENRELSRRLRCKVCLTEAIDTILMPCGHLVVCETCARNITQCPMCRDRIRATAKVHMT